MPRTGVLDVDVRGECVGRCVGVWYVGVFVARVEGARVIPVSMLVFQVCYPHALSSPFRRSPVDVSFVALYIFISRAFCYGIEALSCRRCGMIKYDSLKKVRLLGK